MSSILSRQNSNGLNDGGGEVYVDDGGSFWWTRVRCSGSMSLPVTNSLTDRSDCEMVDLLWHLLFDPSVRDCRVLARQKKDQQRPPTVEISSSKTPPLGR
jgi:hypothetical protein